MHVLLINPPAYAKPRKAIWRYVSSTMPPLGLAWLAAVLEQEGHRVKVLDAPPENLGIDGIVQWVRFHGPFDLVGLTASTPLIGNAIEIARGIRSEMPTTRIVLGGVHPTVLPEEVLSEPAVDVAVRGEGERTILEIAAERPLEDVAGISFRMDGAVFHTPDRRLIDDLNTLPLPAYHLLPMSKYRPAAGAAKRVPATSVLATRGCPSRCTFCYRLCGRRLRVRSGRKVAEEVKLLQDRYGVREVCFYDDIFTMVKREVKAFCAGIRDLGIDLTWSCFSRIDTFNEDTFRMMKDAGCHQVMFGIETSNRQILENIGKRIDPERVEWVVRTTQKIGIEVRAAFMLGNPGETVETMEENIRFAIQLEPDLALFNITTPFPGTEMFEWADRNGLLKTKDWRHYNLSMPVMELPTAPSEKVLEYYRTAHRRFYLRPAYILKRLKRLRSREELWSAVRAMRMLLGL